MAKMFDEIDFLKAFTTVELFAISNSRTSKPGIHELDKRDKIRKSKTNDLTRRHKPQNILVKSINLRQCWKTEIY